MGKNPSIIEVREDVVVVFANNTKNQFYFDIEDLHLVEGIGWQESKDGYLRAKINGKTVLAHTVIAGKAPKGFDNDHKDRNKRNNRRDNLRVISKADNQANCGIRRDNTTGFKGVRRSRNGKYEAKIGHNGKQIFLGTFIDPVEAAKAYDAKAIELKGEYAYTNKDMGLYEEEGGIVDED